MRGLTPDQVEQGLLAEEVIIAQARARQMVWLRAADAMQLSIADGSKSMREWVAGRLDVASETAYRLVTTSKRLEDHPELEMDLAAGEISFDRAEATSRIPATEHKDRHRGVDIQGLRRIAAHHRRMTRGDDHEAHRSQHLTMQPNLDESSWAVWGQLDGYAGAVVDKRLTEEADALPDLPDGSRPGIGYRRALTLTALCEGAEPDGAGSPLITVFVDGDGAGTPAGTTIGPEQLNKIACGASLEVIKTVEGRPLAVGRRTRIISNRLRRLVLHRDGGCTADGCTSRYRLEPHHVVPWSEGGPTDPENLTTLCWFHHHVVVHGRGYRIDPRLGPGRIRFIKPGTDPP